jgi:scyllo-inositol 2-dehydrogenase (NADP+)
VPGLSLTSVVTSNPERAEQARSTYPHVQILPSADELFGAAEAHELAVIAAPNRHHVPLALEAVDAGLHLVVDKPLAANVADAQRLADAAAARGVVASVFHNRRWDGDFLTLRRLIDDGSLGEVVRLESRFDRWRPAVDRDKWREGAEPEDAGGILFDLGPHLIDQALELLGPATSVYAELRCLRPDADVEDDIFLALEHSSGVRSHLSATMLAAQPGPRLRVLGSRATYVKWGVDVQEEALRAGARPGDPGFGEEPPESWGLLGTEDDAQRVKTERGRYVEFYELMERAIRARGGDADGGGEPPPVPLEAGIATLRVIEAARASAAQSVVVPL